MSVNPEVSRDGRRHYAQPLQRHHPLSPNHDIQSLFHRLFRPNPLNIVDILCRHKGAFLEAILNGDEIQVRDFLEIVKAEIAGEIKIATGRSEILKNMILRRSAEFLEDMVEDIKDIDDLISDFPTVSRDGLTLKVKGKLARYEVSLVSCHCVSYCHQNHHKPVHLCIKADCDLKELGSSRLNLEAVRRALQMALSLLHDDKLEDSILYDQLYRIVMCPRCFIEGKIPEESVEILKTNLRCLDEDF